MCGIFGIVIGNKKQKVNYSLKHLMDGLFKLSDSRGKEASGLAIFEGSNVTVYRKEIRGLELIKRDKYSELLDGRKVDAILGHSRLATNGLQTENKNNQPIWDENGLVIHNGIIVNDKFLWKNLIKKRPKFEVDTEIIPALLGYFTNKNQPIAVSLGEIYNLIEGSATIAIVPSNEKKMYLATNTGSLFLYAGNKS